MLVDSARCNRCRAPHPMTMVTVTTDDDANTYWLCQGCGPDLEVALAPYPVIDIDDVDDAEHHAMCRCADCDPDYQFELYRESRWDAERHSTIRIAS